MRFEESLGSEMRDVKCHDSSMKPNKSMGVSRRHNRSKSIPDKKVEEENLGISPESVQRRKLDIGDEKGCNELKKTPVLQTGLQSSLKQEIRQLEGRLEDQFTVRRDLEGALGYRSSSHDTSNETPKPAKELIKEIAVLELEVVYLEQYLLSLYRKAFDRQNSATCPPAKDETSKSPPIARKRMLPEVKSENRSKGEQVPLYCSQLLVPPDSLANPRIDDDAFGVSDTLLDSSVHRSHSTLCQRTAHSFRASPPMDDLAKAVRSCYSQPLSFQGATSGAISLAEHLGTDIADHVPETPTRISEDMVRCMTAMYCKISDPPLIHHGLSSSPMSSLSSASGFSPQDHYDMWSPRYRKDSSFDAQLDNPFNVEGLKDFSGPYSTMVEIPWICRKTQKLKDIDGMLQNYRSLVRRLEKVDLRRMEHEEKLAFWINIHNALGMHALLVYGIPQNNVKRMSLILKAAYNIGGHTISADTIQSSILGCRMPRPVQWLRLLFSPVTKSKARYDRRAYAIEHREPLLYFALCSGSHSDPAIRVYTPKRIFQELEVAKAEYIRATLGVRDERKIILPKIVESFAKDSGICPSGLVEVIKKSMPESVCKMLKPLQGRSRKNIDWVPHNFAFRYLLSNMLVK